MRTGDIIIPAGDSETGETAGIRYNRKTAQWEISRELVADSYEEELQAEGTCKGALWMARRLAELVMDGDSESSNALVLAVLRTLDRQLEPSLEKKVIGAAIEAVRNLDSF